MSTAVISQDFKVHHILKMVEEFTSGSGTMQYVFIGKHSPYENETNPTLPENSVSGIAYDTFREMLFGMLIEPSDVVPMIRNIPWISGKVFVQYDDRTVDWQDDDFYTVVREQASYHVFKCLSNAKGSKSTVMPLRSQVQPDDEFFMTVDGYQWKYLYSIQDTDYKKFATDNYIPVFPNSAVVANAVNGAIETIEVINPGAQLNSYATGAIEDVAVSGNLQVMAIASDVNGQTLTFDITGATGTLLPGQGAQLKLGTTIISIGIIVSVSAMKVVMNVTAEQIGFEYVPGMEIVTNTGTATTSILTRSYLNTLSANAGFYDGSAFYIRSGAGAGQVRTVSQYIIAGNQRRVVLNAPFTIAPNLTSKFEIAPRAIVRGDGEGAEAILSIDRYSNSISHVEILRRGQGYTYANVIITANVGTTSTDTPVAELRAIISPPGGHGSNVYSELSASNLGIGLRLQQTAQINTNEFRTVGIIREPLFQGIILTTDVSGFMFQDGEIVSQSNGARGEVFARIGNTITLTNARGIFSAAMPVTGALSGTSANVSLVSSDMTKFDNRYHADVEIVYDGPAATGFIEDEYVLQTSSGSNATARIFSVVSNIITLTEVRGNFTVSDDVAGVVETFVGQTSGAVAKIVGIKHPDLRQYTGYVGYKENVMPISLQQDQDEIVKIVVKV